MERIPEPELMENEAQALAYARADFADANETFMALFRTVLPQPPETGRAVDLGCGPADITLRFAERHPGWHVDGVDGAEAMLRHGREALARLSLGDRVRLLCIRLPSGTLPAGHYDAVLSNSLLHHLNDPLTLWDTVRQVGRTGTSVLVMDLARPDGPDAARAIVQTYSGDEPEVLRRDFYHSLRAAYRVEEVRGQLDRAGLGSLRVRMCSDRHLAAYGALD